MNPFFSSGYVTPYGTTIYHPAPSPYPFPSSIHPVSPSAVYPAAVNFASSYAWPPASQGLPTTPAVLGQENPVGSEPPTSTPKPTTELSLAGTNRRVQQLCTDREIEEAFAKTLELLDAELLATLLPDSGGTVAVAVPFCGGFPECHVLAEYLTRRLPALPGVDRIDVHAHDIRHTADYAISTLAPHPRLTVHASNLDLLTQPMPQAALSLGVHPQITGPGWDSIIRNVITHSRVSVFFMFAAVERDTLQRICGPAGYACAVRSNPHARAQLVTEGAIIDDLKRYNWIAVVRKLP